MSSAGSPSARREPSPTIRRAAPRVVASLAALLIAATSGGCHEPLDRVPPKRQTTFGQKFFTVVCQRIAFTSSRAAFSQGLVSTVDISGRRYRLACRYGPRYLPADAAKTDPKVATFVNSYDDFVNAIDLIFPDGELGKLQRYMGSILPLTDDDKFPELLRKASKMLGEIERDPGVTGALARLDRRLGYRPRPVALGLVREALNYPRLRPAMLKTLEMVGKGGPANAHFMKLVEAIAFELRTARRVDDSSLAQPQHPSSPARTLRLALDLFLAQSDKLATGKRMWLVKRDWRGVAAVNRQGNTMPAPFVDADNDGFADVDKLGQLVGNGIAAPAPFRLDPKKPDTAPARDGHGRAVDKSGRTLYQYLDVDRTVIAALARDALSLFDPAKHTGLKLVLGASGLLGQRKDDVKRSAGEVHSFKGYVPETAALLDIGHAVMQLLADPKIDDTLDLVKVLVDKHENVVARLIGSALRAKEWGRADKRSFIKPSSKLFDEMMVVLRKILRIPGLLEDVMRSLADPRTRRLPQIFANYLKYRDVHVFDKAYKNIANPTYKTPVDLSKPDTGQNRSIQQRLLHIIANTNGMKMCNKEGALLTVPGTSIRLDGPFKACALFEVKNGAVFYAQAIARLRDSKGNLTSTPKAHLRLKTENMSALTRVAVQTLGADTVLALLSGIDGMSTHPTPQALNRLMFMNPLPAALAGVQDPAIDVDGHVVPTYHEGSLASWEVRHPFPTCTAQEPCTFIDAFRPVAQAFADHDSIPLLVELFTVIHRHWPSAKSGTHQPDPNKPDYAIGTDIRSFEPLMVKVLEQTELMQALNDFSVLLTQIRLPNGKLALDVVAAATRYLLDPSQSPGLRYRDGSNESRASDGSKLADGRPSIYYLMADAWRKKNDALAAADKSQDKLLADAWRDGSSALVDLFLTVDGSGQSARFKNRRFVAITPILVDFVKARLADHRTKGDLARWLGQELPRDLERVLAGPVFATAADFVRAIYSDDTAMAELDKLFSYLVSELSANSAFAATITAVVDLMQLMLDDVDLVPIARFAGRAIAGNTGLVKAALDFLQPAMKADVNESLTRVLRNAYKEQTPGRAPVQTLFDIVTELHRQKPGAGSPYTGPDFASAVRETRDFLSNTLTGLEKFFEIIKRRCGGPPCQTTGP